MSEPIVVPFDGSTEARRAVGAAACLATSGALPVELLTVVPSGTRPTEADLAPLAGLDLRTTQVASRHVADAISTALHDRPGSVVVLGTHARGFVGSLVFGSVSEMVLARSEHPVVLVGPHVPPEPIAPALFVAVDDEAAGRTAAPFAASWAETFHVDPWLLSVAPPAGSLGADRRAGEANLVHRLAAGLRERGVPAQWDVLHGRNVVRTLIDFVTSMGGGVMAVTSERWTDQSHVHVASTARSLVHRAPFPVLVVPARAGVLAAR